MTAASRMRRLLGYPERRPGATIAAIGLLFALAYGASLVALPKRDGRIVVGDAVHHYVQLRSAVFDGDLHFRNEYVRIYNLRGGEPDTDWVYGSTPTGHVRNYMPVGPALVWAPAYLSVAAGVWIADLVGGSYPIDGYGRIYQAAPGLSGILAATLGAWLAFLTAARLYDRALAIWATLAVWLASSTIYYSVISPAYSHASSMLAVALFWFVWVRTLGSPTVGRYGALGLLVGFAALMRWQDAVLLIVPVLDAVRHHRGGASAVLARLAACVAGAAIGFAPQMAVWTVLYGQPLAMPQGAGFMRWSEPALWQVLFSHERGLVTWTPVVGAALAGLAIMLRRHRFVALCAVAFVAISWYVNAAVADWWGGEAFGSRRFISCFPVFVIGFAALLAQLQTRTTANAIIALAFTTHTFLLLVQYQAYMRGLRDIVSYPAEPGQLWLPRFRVPFDLLSWWLNR